MSAWSSSTGKAQLSYADRLRQASKSSVSTTHDPSSSASSVNRVSSQQGSKAGANASISLNASGSQTNRRLSSASSTSTATASGSAPRTPSTPTGANKTSSSVQSSTTPQKDAGPPVNVWEARRKKLAEREAEKERERQATSAQQRKASSAAAATTSTGTNPNTAGKQAKHAAATTPTGPRKANERHSKGPNNPNTSDRKSNKQVSQSSNRTPIAGPISSSTSAAKVTSDRPAVPASGSRANTATSTPKSVKVDSRASEETCLTGKAAQKASVGQTVHSTAPDKADSTDKVQKLRLEDKGKEVDPAKATKKQAEQSTATSSPAQSVAAQASPAAVLSNQTTSAPPVLHDDIPASPATVASAIEEVLKNGGANGAQTEDDDAWLARIHLLNGGQNMPKFGGFGPSGVSGLSAEAETQAAKKAERAVAAAWGAGKSVWNKSQQQHQQQHQSRVPANQETSTSTPEIGAAKEPAQEATHSSDIQKSKDSDSTSAAIPVFVNGITTKSSEASSAAALIDAKTEKADLDATSSKKVNDKDSHPADQQKSGKGAAPQANRATGSSVPPFEDVNNWPSPLDAGKRPSEKPKPVSSSENDKVETAKASQPKMQKSFYDTLDELQLRLAPGANPQQPGNAAGARKGKQQWVSILPEITHSSTSASGIKPNRAAADTKAGKGANRQLRKDGQKGAGTTQAVQGCAKREGGSKAAAKSARVEDRTQAKEGTSDAFASVKVSEGRAKNDGRCQSAPLGGKDGATAKPDAAVRPGMSPTYTNPTRPGATESKPLNASLQNQEVVASQITIAEPSGIATSSPAASASTSSESTSAPAARGEPNAKQPRAARTHLRPILNGVSAPTLQSQSNPNGLRQPQSGASTPGTNRSSPRGSVASSPQVHALPRAAPLPSDAFAGQPTPMFYGPSGAATPMLSTTAPPASAPWLPYNPYTRPPAMGYMFDATPQMGASLPPGVLGQLLGQIEFYFSQHNLQGDFFLRQKMDAQGWVDIGVVAGFKRVQGITRDVAMVKDALLYSAVLDVDEEGMRVRRKFGWELYILAAPDSHVAIGEEGNVEIKDKDKGQVSGAGGEDEPALGVVAASGFGGTLEA